MNRKETEFAELPAFQGEKEAARIAGQFQEAVSFGHHGGVGFGNVAGGQRLDAREGRRSQAARANTCRPVDGNAMTWAARAAWLIRVGRLAGRPTSRGPA